MDFIKYIALSCYKARTFLKNRLSIDFKSYPPDLTNLNSKKNTFQVIGIPRSGTTLLSIILNNHPELLCMDEPFLSYSNSGFFCYFHNNKNNYAIFHPRFVLKSFKKVKAGIKETYRPEISDILKNNYKQGIYTIGIIRDPFATWFSEKNRFNEYDDRLKINTNYFDNWFEFVSWVITENIPYVLYEELIIDPEKSLLPIFNDLQITYTPEILKMNKGQMGGGDQQAYQNNTISTTSKNKYINIISAYHKKELERIFTQQINNFPNCRELAINYLKNIKN